MYCQNCGAQIPDGSKFCSECGNRIGSTNDSSYEEATVITPSMYETRRKTGCLSRTIRAILIIAIIALALFTWLLFQIDIFVYKTYSLNSDHDYSDSEKKEMTELFDGAYILLSNDSYTLFNPETGLGGVLSSRILKDLFSESEKYDADIFRRGNYVYIEITAPNERITFTFYKASIPERLHFVSTYYGL